MSTLPDQSELAYYMLLAIDALCARHFPKLKYYGDGMGWAIKGAQRDVTLSEFKAGLDKGELRVSALNSDSTIFGHNDNLMARAWHDLTHVKLDLLSTDLESEIVVALDQLRQLEALAVPHEIISVFSADTLGQQMYYQQNGEFPKHQQAFVTNYLELGARAALIKV